MLKSVAGIFILCSALGGTAAAAPLAGIEVEFYPAAALSNPGPVLSGAGSDDTLNLQSVSDSDLGTMSGGQGIDIHGDVQLNSGSNASQAINTVSGEVTTGTIENANVSNMSGFNTILLNTGNNVTMQSVTQVNIILK